MSARWIEKLVVAIATMLCAVPMIWLTNKYAANILYWDQWDFYSAFFKPHNWWAVFSWQHGPHRQGLSFVLLEQFNKLTAWNTRAESFYIAALLIAACGVAVAIKKSLFKQSMGMDILIPLVVLTLTQIETLVGTPNPSHSAFPLLMLMAYVYLSLQSFNWVRGAALASLQLFIIFSGYGFNFVPAMLIVLLIDFKRNKKASAFLLGTLTMSCLEFLGNYHTYNYLGEYKSLSGGAPWSVTHCPPFVFKMYATFFGLDTTPYALLIGAISFFSVAGLFFIHLNRFAASRNKISLAFILLAGMSLTFSMMASLGRTDVASRYMTLLIPGFFAVLIHIGTLRPFYRNFTAAAFALLVLNGSAALIAETPQRATWENLANSKNKWIDCYRKTDNIDGCNEQTGFSVYPNATGTRLKEKLDYLKINHLNLFASGKP